MPKPTKKRMIHGETKLEEGRVADVLTQIRVVWWKAINEGFTDFQIGLQPYDAANSGGYYLALSYTRTETDEEFDERVTAWQKAHGRAMKTVAARKPKLIGSKTRPLRRPL